MSNIVTDLISVIIPVYNVEKYIRECFDSLLKQTYSNFEAIVIDDGSTDQSGSVCDEYAKKDDRFRVIHTENNGIGAARNLGLDTATGEYCFFLDPDDVIETDTFCYLVGLLKNYDADMALGVTRQFKGDYTVPAEPQPVETVYYGHTDICENVLFDKSDLKPMGKKREPSIVTYEFFSTLYRMKSLQKNGIRFLSISYGEDTYVCFKSLLTSQRVVTSTKTVYSHRRNPTSTTFRYHPYYLSETKEYYRYYIQLFYDYAPEYLDRGKEGLDGQYLRRCYSAVERELTMAPADRPTREKIKVIREITNDKKYRELSTWNTLLRNNISITKIVTISMKLRIYVPVIYVLDRYIKRKK